ncbi:MAG: Dabb family protein [Planctomycetota bacterium]|nr:Dabb family protein [Planctomycetota bacterium]MDA1177693.1 Dabb family protein [Planctomycetota bacterium]
MTAPLFGHCVYFTLRDRSADRIEQLLLDCHTYLTDHEGLIFFAVGTLADMHREVNDRGFDVALHTVFRDKAAHDRYQVATRHLEFVAKNRDHWSQVRVFDSDMPIT